ncbi:3-deoxy-D-manno-octulosonic acid kinase [Vibrio sinensis]|uniref:3-deoxy-D-manno-octulosonic acid kinase n=1 Tax=Vibrio sinensis TaxID=2302434 RepID=A0A3A6QII5_9VIBR|nr:3-deoxy-D-manno-octulosonic acid kinase [Vibrio sinensis]RJX72393.1 3-deoxy-D-manno-octulosonic acid kinase [Vibrio sinensis]
MFTHLVLNNTHFWYDSALLSEDIHRVFDIQFWKEQQAVLGSAQGRGTTWFVQGDRLELAIRHYHRGGLFGKIVKDHYWFTGIKKNRAFQELVLLDTLHKQGVNVPRPVAARIIKQGFTYQADIIIEKIANARDLVAVLQEQQLEQRTLHDIGCQIRAMHDAGVNHTDLNIHNILLDAEQKVWIIDFDKCYRQQGESWKKNNLDRLQRSFLKEQRLRNIPFSNTMWTAILAGYEETI